MRLPRLCSILAAAVPALPLAAQRIEVAPAIPGASVRVTGHTVELGPTRVIAREARSPLVTEFRDGTIVVTGGNPIYSTNIRSVDFGTWWEPQSQYMGFLNTRELRSGLLLVLDYDLVPLEPGSGVFQVTRYTSADRGLSLQGPFRNGRATLPPALFDPTRPHWFNEFIELPNGDLLGAVQTWNAAGDWRTSLLESTDGGLSWTFKSIVASKETIADPTGMLTAGGWPLYYAVEPTLVDAGNGHLVAVLRTANDEAPMPTTQIGPARTRYRDLSHTVRGDGVHSGIMSLPANRYYEPGPPNAPLILTHSFDGGATWSPAAPMANARGVQPRLASDGAGMLVLTFGGLSGVPRWGHALAFSTDGGVTWSRAVPFSRCLTTGYTEVVATGPGRFVCFFDCAPPQPWTDWEKHWIGAVDVRITAGAGPGPPPAMRTPGPR